MIVRSVGDQTAVRCARARQAKRNALSNACEHAIRGGDAHMGGCVEGDVGISMRVGEQGGG